MALLRRLGLYTFCAFFTLFIIQRWAAWRQSYAGLSYDELLKVWEKTGQKPKYPSDIRSRP